MTRKTSQTTEYKQRKRRGRRKEVLERYETTILGNPGTTFRLEKEGSATTHPPGM